MLQRCRPMDSIARHDQQGWGKLLCVRHTARRKVRRAVCEGRKLREPDARGSMMGCVGAVFAAPSGQCELGAWQRGVSMGAAHTT